MSYDPQKHHRRSIRLKGYDYTRPGAYYVTLVAYQRDEIFGQFADGVLKPSQAGEIVATCWKRLPQFFPHLELDEFCLMPNHFHAILWLKGEAFANGANASPLRDGTVAGSLGAMVQNFKAVSTRQINKARRNPGDKVWQRNYYEHIIRDDGELRRIQQYIRDNPLNWAIDKENPVYGRGEASAG